MIRKKLVRFLGILVILSVLFSMIACQQSENDPGVTTAVTTTAAVTTTKATTTTPAVTTTKAETTAAVKIVVNNETQKKGYGTIQEAVKEAKAGDTLVVEPGTYSEGAILLTVKGVTLKSAKGAAETIIKGEIGLSADNLKVDGFTIDGTGRDRCIQGIKGNGIVISNNVLTNCLRGIQGGDGPCKDAQIIKNTFKSDYGIAGSEPFADATVKDNTFLSKSEAVGVGTTFTIKGATDVVKYLQDNNKFEGTGKVVDYRPAPAPAKVLVHIGDTGYATIQEAVKAAKAGDTIVVDPGTYEEGAIILTLKGVTLKSKEGAEKTIIKGEVQIAADNLTVDGFTIDGTGRDRCILGNKGSNALITNNILTNCLRGIQGGDGPCSDIQIIKNTFKADYGIAGSEPFANATIKDNTFLSKSEATGVGVGFTIKGSDDVIKYLQDNNKFEGTGKVVDYRPAPAVTTAPKAEEVTGAVVNETQKKGYATIVAAVKEAKDGDTIAVKAGTYDEGAIILSVKGVTLKSKEGAEKTIIKGEVQIAADNLTVDGFTIDGTGRDRCILGNKGSNALITNNILTDCLRGIQGGDGPCSDTQIIKNTFKADYGIAGTEPFTNATIKDNTFLSKSEAVGVGKTFTVKGATDIIKYLQDNNKFEGTGKVVDYR